jgi:hypothetical protein
MLDAQDRYASASAMLKDVGLLVVHLVLGFGTLFAFAWVVAFLLY